MLGKGIDESSTLGPLINVVQQPLALLSGVLLPLALAPAWLLAVAKVNPFYWATTGARDLFAGRLDTGVVWYSMLLMAVLATLAVWWASTQFARKVS